MEQSVTSFAQNGALLVLFPPHMLGVAAKNLSENPIVRCIAPESSGMDDLARNDPEPLRAFSDAIAGNDPKTIAAYRTILQHLVAELATIPSGEPFRMDLVTATAIS